MTPSAASNELAELLRELLAEVRGLRTDLAARQHGPEARIALLLRAIHTTLADAPFTAAHVVALSKSPLSTRIALRHAVADRSAGSVGKILAAHVELRPGLDVGGLTLERIGRGRPAQYRIRRCDDDRRDRPHAHAWPI